MYERKSSHRRRFSRQASALPDRHFPVKKNRKGPDLEMRVETNAQMGAQRVRHLVRGNREQDSASDDPSLSRHSGRVTSSAVHCSGHALSAATRTVHSRCYGVQRACLLGGKKAPNPHRSCSRHYVRYDIWNSECMRRNIRNCLF